MVTHQHLSPKRREVCAGLPNIHQSILLDIVQFSRSVNAAAAEEKKYAGLDEVFQGQYIQSLSIMATSPLTKIQKNYHH